MANCTLTGYLNRSTNLIPPKTQEKEVIPTKEIQEVTPDVDYNGLSKVTVKEIPANYIEPAGTKEINDNGIVDVTNFKNANVNLALGSKKITENGIYNSSADNLKGYDSVEVAVPESTAKLGTKDITVNANYKAETEGLDGYSEVNVNVPGVDINEYFTLSNSSDFVPDKAECGGWSTFIKRFPVLKFTKDTYVFNCFYEFKGETIDGIEGAEFLTSVTQFLSTTQLKTIPDLNFVNAKDMSYLFSNNTKTESIGKINCDSAISIQFMFAGNRNLTNLGGLINMGKSYNVSKQENYASYEIGLKDCILLTHESLMNVINNLYDIKTKGVKPQKLTLGADNLAKLTLEEIAIATNKGWTVS